MPPQIPHVELTDTLGEELALFAFGLLEVTGQCTWLGIWKPAAPSPTSSPRDQERDGRIVLIHPPVAAAPDLKQRMLAHESAARSRSPELPEPGMYMVRSGSGKWRQSPWNGISYLRL